MSLEVVSRKKNQLETHSIYMDSSSSVSKKKSATPMSVQKAQDQTSETLGGYSSTNSISNDSEKSNTKFSLKDSEGI